MTDQPSKMMRDVLDKIEQEKRERPTPPPPPLAAPAATRPARTEQTGVSPRQMSLLPSRPQPQVIPASISNARDKTCPICHNLATFRRPHRYHCATCHVFIDLD